MFKKILAPIDLSEQELARRAVAAAVAQAKAAGAALRLVNVQALAPVAMMDYLPPSFDEELRANAEKELASLCETIDYPADLLSKTVRFGAIYPEVLAEAEAFDADLIVLCSHRPTMASYFLGSTASAVVRHAKCSVLVLRE